MSVYVLIMGDYVLAQRIQYCDYTLWMTHQGTESRVPTFRSDEYNISSVPKSSRNKTVSVSKSFPGDQTQNAHGLFPLTKFLFMPNISLCQCLFVHLETHVYANACIYL